MKRRTIGISLVIFTLILSSCINIFSVFNGGNVDNISSEERLVSMGQAYLNNLQYELAYGSFEQALVINPQNSVAREGISTAYLFWKVPVTNIINAIISEDYALIGMNSLYDASEVVSTNLWHVIDGNTDGAIPALDNSINLNYFVFNTVYSTFMLIDTDNDGNILMDTNDIYTVYPDFSFSNNLPDVSNFIEVVQMIYAISQKTNKFETLFGQSILSLSNVEAGLTSQEAINMIDGIKAPILDLKVQMDSYLTQFNSYDSLSQFGISNDNEITNVLLDSGYTNYTDLTNDLASVGIINLNDITNTFPDLTNFTSILSNLYGL